MTTEREQIRITFLDAWLKQQQGAPLDALERQLVDCINAHPEYHADFNDRQKVLHADFRTDNNPFLHLSLHHALREQIRLDRPAGITAVYETLCRTRGDCHQVEHLMMDVMATLLWEAERSNQLADQAKYLEQLRQLL